MMFKQRWILGITLLLAMLFLSSTTHAQGIFRITYAAGDQVLTVELLDNDLAHFQLSDSAADAIWTTPMVAKTDYAGPTLVNLNATNIIETPEMRVEVDEATLCVTVTDIARDVLLTSFCALEGETKGLTFTQEGTTDLYGLGEQFQRRGGTVGNWMGLRRRVLNLYGNEMTSFNGGNVGNAQFPILYALGAGMENYALFLDDFYQQYWDFSGDPFFVQTQADALRWYVMTGADLPDLRRDYMELTGRPPVPPRQMFGLWVSEYGYENWDELSGVVDSMQDANFPLDGMVMDLQWFGGIDEASNGMGGLAWDEENFPDPAGFIAALREDYGIGVMTIEESYVSETLPDYADLNANDVLLRECEADDCELIRFDEWWGEGGMVDWSNPAVSAWWHDNRRQHLINQGVIGHWTDLGEPEIFNDGAWYYGFPDFGLHGQADVHNLYNFLWSQSIWDGYARNGVDRRPFILSRSGTSGSQRYGVAMWSGDIAANMPSFEAQMNVQMHMSLSGIDYFGSDVGGFYRQVFDPVLGMEGMYSLWLANSVLTDVPLRPHAANLQNLFQTAPSLIGDVASNLANVRLRYQLSPYMYTLAHNAYRYGDPVIAPMVYYYQDDPNVRTMGSQKMIGADLMMVTVTGYDEEVPVYLPAGGWYDYYTNEYYSSEGGWMSVPRTVDGILRVPLFVRAGAIIPQMYVDDETQNMLGQRRDGTVRDDLIISVYTSAVGNNFTLIEDDGETMAYQDGAVRETVIGFESTITGWQVTVGAATGTYEGAASERFVDIRVIDSGYVPPIYRNTVSVDTPIIFDVDLWITD